MGALRHDDPLGQRTIATHPPSMDDGVTPVVSVDFPAIRSGDQTRQASPDQIDSYDPIQLQKSTDRSNAINHLNVSDERLRLALEAASIGAWDWYIPTDTVVWSPTLCALLGLTAETRTLTTDEFRLRFVHPDDQLRTTTQSHSIVKGDDFERLAYRAIRADGVVRNLVDVGRVIERAEDGTPVRSAGVTMDVTDLESAIAELNVRQMAVQASNSGIVIIDATDERLPIIDVNPAFERVTGYPRALVIGRSSDLLTYSAADPATSDALASAMRSGEPATVTLFNHRQDGSTFWIQLHIAPVRDRSGTLTHFVGVTHDVTSQRQFEEELRFQSELLNQATVAIVASDRHGNVTHWNRHAESLYGWTIEEALGKPVSSLITDTTHGDQTRSVLEHVRTGRRWEGEVICFAKDGTRLTVHLVNSPIRDQLGAVLGVVGVSVDISDRKDLEARLAYLATHDALTGLPNRVLLADRLSHAIHSASRRGETIGVIMLDLDRFKLVNDDLGHAAGDELLITVGQRLRSAIRDADTLARFAGDEFVIVQENASVDRARVLAGRVQQALKDPFTVAGREVVVAASIGIAISSADRSAADDLLRDADVALYRAKRAGRGTSVVFDPAEPDFMSGWLALEADLRRAIPNNELVLDYQPIIDLADGSLVSVEALIRWHHPTRGLLAPNTFVPLAEETGLICSMTHWAINRTAWQVRRWQTVLGADAPKTVHINLTSPDIRSTTFVEIIQAALQAEDLPPGSIVLEITEHVLVDEVRAAERTLEHLRHMGIELAIDDFGASASSLSSLRAVQAHLLKLDRSFVRGMTDSDDDRIVVSAIVAMAHALSIRVTAEGIETEEQLHAAQDAGCDLGQGFLLARPMSPNALNDWVKQRSLTSSLPMS